MAHAALLGVLLQVAAAAGGTCPQPWGYGATNGPDLWGQMDPGWVECDTGRRQSPIDISGAELDATLPRLTVSYGEGTYPVVLQNTGHDVKVTPLFAGTLEGGPDTATLIQFHIHYPAEHAGIDRDARGELHLVHQLPDNGALIVLAVPVHEGASNPAFAKLLALLPGECRSRKTVDPREYVDLGALLPESLDRYSFYGGSLTTPACAQTVSWFVFSRGIAASADQIARFRAHPDARNARPLQPRLGREVTRRP